MEDFIFRDIKYGIQNLIKWFPVIWKDRSWDYIYLLDILSFKLSLMKYAAENYWNTMGAENNAKDMGIAIALIDRISNEYQENIAIEKHERKWGTPELRCVPYGHNECRILCP